DLHTRRARVAQAHPRRAVGPCVARREATRLDRRRLRL
ncbi:MAG: hypothetical protein AVDCRST_MAG30-4671, partial [uncultured Solirubrobacteraceae bacterium]